MKNKINYKQLVYAVIGAGVTIFTFSLIAFQGMKQEESIEDPLLTLQEEQTPLASGISDVESDSKGYIYKQEGAFISMDTPALPAIAKLGTPESYKETDKCAYGDVSKTYVYDDVEISTYTKEEIDYISAVFISNPDVLTPEGVGVGMLREDMESAYGTDYEEKAGICTYEKDGKGLEFMLEDDEIVYIQYLSSQYMQ